MAVSRSNIIMSTIETAGDRGVGLLFLLPSNTVSTVSVIPLAHNRESGDAPSHGGYAQTDRVGGYRAVPITSLEAEIVALRHQLNVLRRKSPKRLAFSNFDRLIFASLYRISPRIVNALAIVKPETVIRWHRNIDQSFGIYSKARSRWDLFGYGFDWGRWRLMLASM
jgi:hypothetical protein